MTASTKAIRLLGIPMLLIGICIAAITLLHENTLAGYIIEGAPALSALLAGVHMLFMYGKERHQWMMPAAFMVIAAIYLLMLVSIIVICIAFTFEAVWFSVSYVFTASLTGLGIYAFCAINLIMKGRLKSAAVAAMTYDTILAIYSAVTGFSAMTLITVFRSALMTSYLIISPGNAGTSGRSGRKAVIAALVLLAISALMHVVDIAEYFATLEGSVYVLLIAINAAPVLSAACFILYNCAPGIRACCPMLLPAGFLLMATPIILNMLSRIIDGSFYITYIMILMLVCAVLCIAGCFAKKRVLWEAAALVMAIYLLAQLSLYIDSLLTTVLCFVSFTYADVISDIWYALETVVAGIGIILYLVGGRNGAAVSVKFKLPTSQPSTIESDLHNLKLRFESGELTEEEYNALRTERLERP